MTLLTAKKFKYKVKLFNGILSYLLGMVRKIDLQLLWLFQGLIRRDFQGRPSPVQERKVA